MKDITPHVRFRAVRARIRPCDLLTVEDPTLAVAAGFSLSATYGDAFSAALDRLFKGECEITRLKGRVSSLLTENAAQRKELSSLRAEVAELQRHRR